MYRINRISGSTTLMKSQERDLRITPVPTMTVTDFLMSLTLGKLSWSRRSRQTGSPGVTDTSTFFRCGFTTCQQQQQGSYLPSTQVDLRWFKIIFGLFESTLKIVRYNQCGVSGSGIQSPEMEYIEIIFAKIYRFSQLSSHSRGFFLLGYRFKKSTG